MSSISGNLLLEAETEQHYLEIIIQFNFFIHQFPATYLTDNTNDDGDGVNTSAMWCILVCMCPRVMIIKCQYQQMIHTLVHSDPVS